MRKRLACRPLQASPAVVGQISPFHGRKRPNTAHLNDRRGPGTRRQPQKPTILAHGQAENRYANVRIWPFSLLICSQAKDDRPFWRYLNSGRPKPETALRPIGYPSSQGESPDRVGTDTGRVCPYRIRGTRATYPKVLGCCQPRIWSILTSGEKFPKSTLVVTWLPHVAFYDQTKGSFM